MTAVDIKDKIPCSSRGTPKTMRLKEIYRLLEKYTFSEQILLLLWKEVEQTIRAAGHHGWELSKSKRVNE